MVLQCHQEPAGSDEPLISFLTCDGPRIDHHFAVKRRGVDETELCLRIVDPLDEQAAHPYSLSNRVTTPSDPQSVGKVSTFTLKEELRAVIAL